MISYSFPKLQELCKYIPVIANIIQEAISTNFNLHPTPTIGQISIDFEFVQTQFITVANNSYYEFLDDHITGNFAQNVNIYIEITDVAGSTANDHPSGEYRSDLGPLTFSRDTIKLDIETGRHLLAPPVQQDLDIENKFADLNANIIRRKN